MRVEQVVRLDPPPGWCIRSWKDGEDLTACRLEDRETDLSLLPVSFSVTCHPTTQGMEEFVEALMRRRVPRGLPDRWPDHIGPYLCTCNHWTDGVTDILSWFMRPAPGMVCEVRACGFLWESPRAGHVATLFESRLRWIAGAGDPNV